MCGLVGFSGSIPYDKDKLSVLFMYNEKRGTHSAGLFNGKTLYKHVKDVSAGLLPKIMPTLETTKILIGHTRQGTTGAQTAKNAHPFHYSDVVMAHNGVVDNWTTLCDYYGVNSRDFEVDSEILCYGLNASKDEEVLERFTGHAALLYTRAEQRDVLNVFRTGGRTLFVGYINYTSGEKTAYFSSIYESLLVIGCNDIQLIPLGVVYSYKHGKIISKKSIELNSSHSQEGSIKIWDYTESKDARTFQEKRIKVRDTIRSQRSYLDRLSTQEDREGIVVDTTFDQETHELSRANKNKMISPEAQAILDKYEMTLTEGVIDQTKSPMRILKASDQMAMFNPTGDLTLLDSSNVPVKAVQGIPNQLADCIIRKYNQEKSIADKKGGFITPSEEFQKTGISLVEDIDEIEETLREERRQHRALKDFMDIIIEPGEEVVEEDDTFHITASGDVLKPVTGGSEDTYPFHDPAVDMGPAAMVRYLNHLLSIKTKEDVTLLLEFCSEQFPDFRTDAEDMIMGIIDAHDNLEEVTDNLKVCAHSKQSTIRKAINEMGLITNDLLHIIRNGCKPYIDKYILELSAAEQTSSND